MGKKSPQIQDQLNELIALCEKILVAVGKEPEPVVKAPAVKGAKK